MRGVNTKCTVLDISCWHLARVRGTITRPGITHHMQTHTRKHLRALHPVSHRVGTTGHRDPARNGCRSPSDQRTTHAVCVLPPAALHAVAPLFCISRPWVSIAGATPEPRGEHLHQTHTLSRSRWVASRREEQVDHLIVPAMFSNSARAILLLWPAAAPVGVDAALLP